MLRYIIFFLISALICIKAHPHAAECHDTCREGPFEVSFIVDGSASIWRDNFTQGLWFMQRFVDQFEIAEDKVRVSVVTFGNRVYSEDAINFDDHTDKHKLNEAIDSIPYRAGTYTATGAAIKWFMENQKPQQREGERNVVIVLTDGNSQESEVTAEEAKKMHDEGLEVIAIGVGSGVSDQELHNIASSYENVYRVDKYDMLNDIIYRLSYQTCGVAPEPLSCRFDPVDIAFVIDSSRSIGEQNFTLGKEFIKDFIDSFQVDESSFRVGAIMFGHGIYEEHAIHFDDHQTKKEAMDAILALPYMQGSQTDTSDGIKYVTDHLLPSERKTAAHLCIVITDGKSQRWMDTENEAKAAREDGITMFAVGVGQIGKQLDEKELEEIAGDPSRVKTTADYSKLGEITEELLHMTCDGIIENRKQKGEAFHDNEE